MLLRRIRQPLHVIISSNHHILRKNPVAAAATVWPFCAGQTMYRIRKHFRVSSGTHARVLQLPTFYRRFANEIRTVDKNISMVAIEYMRVSQRVFSSCALAFEMTSRICPEIRLHQNHCFKIFNQKPENSTTLYSITLSHPKHVGMSMYNNATYSLGQKEMV